MRFKLFGIKIFVSFPFCLIICLVLLIDKTGLFLPTIIAAAIHEAGHLFCMFVFDCLPLEIRFVPCGIEITKRRSDYGVNTVLLSLAGPMLNIAVALTSFMNYYLYNRENVLYFAAINLVLGLFNLLPARGLDGGTIVISMLFKKFSLNTSERILTCMSFFISLLFLSGAVFVYLSGIKNLSLILASFYIAFCALFMKKE